MTPSLVRRTNFSEDSSTHFHHNQYPIYLNSSSSRSDGLKRRLREICRNPLIVFIVKCLHLIIVFPYRCLMQFTGYEQKWSSHQRNSCEYGSVKYFISCGLSGMLACGVTHTALVPLDLIKCRLQVKPQKYQNLISGFRITIAEEGLLGLSKGWAATLIGYSFQGLGKFGFYEIFKVLYAGLLGEETAYQYRTTLYLLASASAEIFADIALAPWEATKVRIQTQDNWASSLRRGLPKLYAEEGLWGFYKGLVPLWLRQVPYTMMKFACFERTVEAIYKYVMPRPRDQCSKSEQLAVTFVAGYIAGIFCAIVSHPADTIVSKLNNEKGLHLFDAIRRIGFAGMWKGLGTRIFMIGTLTGLQWFLYDMIKVFFRIPRPSATEGPMSLSRKLSSADSRLTVPFDINMKN